MAINNCTFMGRLTRDPELRHTTTNKAVVSFTIAVDRDGKDAGCDFIPCHAWEKKAEFISRYWSKGSMIAIEGEMRSRSYEDKDKNKRTVLECRVSKVSFTGEGKRDGAPPTEDTGGEEAGFHEVDDDGELPF